MVEIKENSWGMERRGRKEPGIWKIWMSREAQLPFFEDLSPIETSDFPLSR